MTRINPQKLLNSKWTAVNPVNSEKHFIVTDLDIDDTGTVVSCSIEAIISGRLDTIDWRELKNVEQWIQGWT